MAEQTDANNLAELARHLRAEGVDVIALGLVVDLHGVNVTLDPDGDPIPQPPTEQAL